MLQELQTQHRQILRLRVQGCKPQEIADRMGLSLIGVYSILNDPLAKSYMARLDDEADSNTLTVRRKLAELQLTAVKKLGDLLEDKAVTPAVQLATAKDVLDRTGHKPVEKHQITHAHFTANDIALLQERMRLAQEEHDQAIIDVTDADNSVSA